MRSLEAPQASCPEKLLSSITCSNLVVYRGFGKDRIALRVRTCAFRNKPPVLPPKMGEGVLGSSWGGVKGSGSFFSFFSAGFFSAVSAAITRRCTACVRWRGAALMGWPVMLLPPREHLLVCWHTAGACIIAVAMADVGLMSALANRTRSTSDCQPRLFLWAGFAPEEAGSLKSDKIFCKPWQGT